MDRRNRPVTQMLGIQNDEIAPTVLRAIGLDCHQVAFALACRCAARREAGLRERDRTAEIEVSIGPGLIVEPCEGRAAAALYVRIRAIQEAIAIRHRVVAIILSRQRANMRVELLNAVTARPTPRQID